MKAININVGIGGKTLFVLISLPEVSGYDKRF